MTTDKHVDPAAPLPKPAADDADSDLEEVPEGAVRFELEPEAIADALAAPSLQVLHDLACATAWFSSCYRALTARLATEQSTFSVQQGDL
jgi:hypothetical protein